MTTFVSFIQKENALQVRGAAAQKGVSEASFLEANPHALFPYLTLNLDVVRRIEPKQYNDITMLKLWVQHQTGDYEVYAGTNLTPQEVAERVQELVYLANKGGVSAVPVMWPYTPADKV